MRHLDNPTASSSAIECVIIEWHKLCYMLPIELMVEVALLESRKCIDTPQAQNSDAVGLYLWQARKIPIYTLDLKPYHIKVNSKVKIAVLHAQKNTNPYQSDHIAVLFEREAKTIMVYPEELTWIEPNNGSALLQQSRLTQQVTLYQSELYR